MTSNVRVAELKSGRKIAREKGYFSKIYNFELKSNLLLDKKEDQVEVSLLYFHCQILLSLVYRIVCLTNYSSKSLSARIKVVISGKVGHSKDFFHYQVSEFE